MSNLKYKQGSWHYFRYIVFNLVLYFSYSTVYKEFECSTSQRTINVEFSKDRLIIKYGFVSAPTILLPLVSLAKFSHFGV